MAQATARATTIRVGTNVRPDEHAQLKTLATERRVQIAAVLRWAIEEYLDREIPVPGHSARRP